MKRAAYLIIGVLGAGVVVPFALGVWFKFLWLFWNMGWNLLP